MAAAAPKAGGLMNILRTWAVSKSGYRRLGLRVDDLIMEEVPGMKEALKRLPPQEVYDREFRLKVAIDLSAKHQILPKNLWTTDETDIRYLSPILEEVQKELEERANWDAKNK